MGLAANRPDWQPRAHLQVYALKQTNPEEKVTCRSRLPPQTAAAVNRPSLSSESLTERPFRRSPPERGSVTAPAVDWSVCSTPLREPPLRRFHHGLLAAASLPASLARVFSPVGIEPVTPAEDVSVWVFSL
ncbi:unnamed protein product, partial [Gadus morhua 'NCC']